MSLPPSLSRRLPLVLVGLGVLTVGAGAVLQSRGIVVPSLLGSDTTFGVMARLGGIAVILGLLAFAATQLFAPDDASDSAGAAAPRRRAGRHAADTPFDRLVRDGAPATRIAGEDRPPASAAPDSMADWQRRLAEKAAVAGPVVDTPTQRTLAQNLHRGALAVVILCFVTLLGFIIWTQIAASLNAPPPAQTMTQDELIAAIAADYLVPDAPKDRHWTEIDLTGVVEWVVARGLLAMSGDTSAMIEMGAMIGGLMLLMFGIRVFFMLRRANARRFRPSDISSMGYR